jgi:hypothetical protein
MSYDLVMYAEHANNQEWRVVGGHEANTWFFPEETPETQWYQPVELYRTGNTILHAMLVGWGNYGWTNKNRQPFEVLAPPRGLPLNLGPELREWVTDQEYLPHASWLWLEEVLSFDWRGKMITRQAMVEPDVAQPFRGDDHPFPVDTWPKDRPYFYREWLPNGVTVTWRHSYAEGGGAELLQALEPLRTLGAPNTIRLVFWLD